MAESARQKRMRELGVTSSISSPSTHASNKSLSAREIRKIELGVAPDTRVPEQSLDDIRSSQRQVEQKVGFTPKPNTQPLEIKKSAAPAISKPSYLDNLKSFLPSKKTITNFISPKALKTTGKTALDVIGRPSEIMAEYATPDAPFIGDKGLIPGTNARKAFLDRTGQKPATGFGEKALGMITAPFAVPGAGLGAGNEIANVVGNTMERFAPKLAQTLGGKALTGAAVGAPLTAGQELATGKGNLKDAAVSGAIGAGMGAVAPLLATGISKGASAVIEKYKGTNVEKAINTTKPAEVEKSVSDTMQGGKPSKLASKLTQSAETPKHEQKYLKSVQNLDEFRNKLNTKYGENDKYSFLDNSHENALIIRKQDAEKALLKRGYTRDSIEKIGTQEQDAKETVIKSELKPSENAAPIPEQIEPVKQSWFTRLFGEQNVGFTPFGSNKSGRMVSTEQQIVNNPLKSNIKGAVETTKQAGRALYQNTVDFLHPLKDISPATYDTAMDASRANNLANTLIHDKFVDNEGNVIGSSLNDIMKTVRGLDKKFDDYLILRHSIDRMGREENVYDPALKMTAQKAEDRVKVLEQRYPQLKQAGQMWNEFHGNLLDSGVKEGLLTPEARQAMREASPNYASMRRQFTIGEKLAQPKFGSGGSSFSGQSAPIKSVSPNGSFRKIVTPIRSATEQAYAWKNAELRNRTMQEVVKTIQINPEAMKGIVSIVKKPSTSYGSLDDALRQGGSEEFLNQLDNDFKSLFKPAKAGEENIVRAMVNGHPVYVKVHNPEAVKALLGLGSEQSGIVLGAMQKLSNATKRGATGVLAPMFAVKNLTADTFQAAIQSPNAFKHIAVDLPHALFSSIGDILKIPGLKNLAEDFRRSGGEYSALLRGDRQLNRSIYQLRKVAPLTPEGLVKGAYNVGKGTLKGFEKLADTTENINRMAAFRRAMNGKERTPENVRNAINAARESTTNYSRKGSFAKETEAVIPYSNAAMQGIYRVGRAFVKNPVKTLAGVSTLVLAPKLYEYAKFNDDPDYQKLPARERYRNIIISKNKDGTFNKQPMPPEYEAFGAFMTDVLNDVVNKDPQAYKGTMDALVNAFTPPLVSGAAQGFTQGGGVEKSLVGAANATVAAPFVSTIANQSFTGAPIVPRRLQDNSPEFQSDERTSKVAQAIGRKIDLAPLKVDYLLRAYGGDPARLILPLTSDAGGGMPKATLLKNFIVDPVFTNTLSNDFYDAKDKYTKANNDYTQFDKPLPKWFDEGTHELLTSQAKGSVSKELAAYAQDKRDVQADKTLSKEDKADKLREIQSEINKIYVDVNSDLLKAGYKFPNR